MAEAVGKRRGLSPFSVILTMVALMVVGAGMIPMLSVRYTPSLKRQDLTLSFRWNGASARVIEQEVTSKIEGVVSSVRGIEEVNSVTGKESGQVTVSIKKGENVDAIRFEIATLMKQLYPHLPEKVSYPNFSTNTSGEERQTLVTYTLNAPIATSLIQRYAEEHIMPALSRIDGVGSVDVYGATPYEWEIRFNPAKCAVLGITAADVAAAINAYRSENVLGMASEQTTVGDTMQVRVWLVNGTAAKDGEEEARRGDGNTVTGYAMWDEIPIANSHGRIVHLKDIATVSYKEQLPNHYYRINGLNNINLSVTAEKYVNTLEVSAEVKKAMKRIESWLPENYSVIVAYDSSEGIRKELNKIYLRTTLSIAILLLFVYVVSRKWRYLFLIVVTLTANVLLSFIFYCLFRLEIHLYSMAGITVSLGLIIDTSIIMIDHYSYYRNRKAFLAILAALLTTVGALTIVFFLPEGQRNNLVDFSMVIIINLAVSMWIALLFVPALLEVLPIRPRKGRKLVGRRRRIVRFTRLYGRFITFTRRRGSRWALAVIAVLAFGIPIHLLPAKIEGENGEEPEGKWAAWYNKTIGSDYYQNRLKKVLEPVFGGSLRMFTERVFSSDYYNDPQRTRLYVRAAMAEGCTIHQLNDVIRHMENYLSQYEEIDLYETHIYSYDNSVISITFRPEAEETGFPVMLKGILISKANELGGADWSIYGIGQGFSNALGGGYKSNKIRLTGYNYDMLYAFAEEMIDTLVQNKRVMDPEIKGSDGWRSKNYTEYFIDFDFERFAQKELSPSDYYQFLTQQLYSNSLNPIIMDGQQVPVALVSSESKDFDVWHLRNDIITMDGKSVKLADLGNMAKRRSGNDIYKTNQVYSLYVMYDFLGPYELAKRVMQRVVKDFNRRLPLGFKADEGRWSYGWGAAKMPYGLLFLVIAIIYLVCAVLFESWWQPLVIIVMIPVSFIGVFLTFYLFKFPFDQGGFASFVLLCGIVVNAGIYLINEYNLTCRASRSRGLRCYLKSYNHKIIPIFLTVVSTILGLIPFVCGGTQEVFWFSFAVGAMGGMVFSILALIVYLPLCMKFE